MVMSYRPDDEDFVNYVTYDAEQTERQPCHVDGAELITAHLYGENQDEHFLEFFFSLISVLPTYFTLLGCLNL